MMHPTEPRLGNTDSLIAALKQAHDALVHAGFYIACSQPGMDDAGLLCLRQAISRCRAALRSAEAVGQACDPKGFDAGEQ